MSIASRLTDISVNGKSIKVPAVTIDGLTVIARGRFPRIAAVRDEGFTHCQFDRGPAAFIAAIADCPLRADVVSFAQRVDEPAPKYAYPYEWDNAAVIDTSSFANWWEKLPQATRKNCRRAERRGVVTSTTTLDDHLAQGIKAIYDEAPLRQGRRFWHYGKDLETVRRENGSYLDRSDFISSYFERELIGFMKIVYVDRIAMIMQILSREAHFDKRPMNALIARAVEVCGQKGMTHLVYSKFQYGNKIDDPMIEFKRRNGFVRVNYPRYYVPITRAGQVAVTLRLYRGILEILPPQLLAMALRGRASITRRLAWPRSAAERPERAVNQPDD